MVSPGETLKWINKCNMIVALKLPWILPACDLTLKVGVLIVFIIYFVKTGKWGDTKKKFYN